MGLTVTFRGPFVLVGNQGPVLFADDIAEQSGIYLWVVPHVDGALIVTYVGETQTSFGQRLKEHAIQTLGGNYRISDPEPAHHGVDEALWNGLWRPGTRDRLPEYIERFVDLAPVIRKTLLAVRVLAAPLQAEMRVRRRIDAPIANYIQRQPPPGGSLLPHDIRFARRRDDENPIPVLISSAADVLGFPATLDA